MSGLRETLWALNVFIFSASLVSADGKAVERYEGSIYIDNALTLAQVISTTLEHYPDYLMKAALDQEISALQLRGNSWLAGAPRVGMRYEDDLPGDDIGSREIELEVELPLWNWGQRSAGQNVAEQALNSVKKQMKALKLKVAGLVRSALWGIALEELHYQQAGYNLELSTKLLDKIKHRVDFGDLPRTDLLLAQSHHLQKKSKLLQAEKKMKRVRTYYTNLTQMKAIPANFQEELSEVTEITHMHPMLLAIDALIQRKQAQLNWVKSKGSGQSSFIVGGKSEKDAENDDDIESMSVEISIPFGGTAYLQAEIAIENLALTQLLTQRAHLFRRLEKQQYGARQSLQVNRVELDIAKQLKQLAEERLKMTRLSFSVGEINLMDLLKIQASSTEAFLYAEEHEIMLNMNIALYNQAVGMLP